MTARRATGPTGPNASSRTSDRRSYWIAGLVLFAAIAGLTTITVLTASFGPRRDTNGQLQEQGGAKPHIIPRPDEGEAPKHPSDRGGWQQFLVLALVVGGIGSVFGLAWRSSRRARVSSRGRPAPRPQRQTRPTP